jgi:hypothetical protein
MLWKKYFWGHISKKLQIFFQTWFRINYIFQFWFRTNKVLQSFHPNAHAFLQLLALGAPFPICLLI